MQVTLKGYRIKNSSSASMGENVAYFRVDPQKQGWWPSFLSNQINSLTFFNNVQSFNGNIWESYIFREEM